MNWSNSVLVLGDAQPIEEILELALLILEPPQRLGTIVRRRPICRSRAAGPTTWKTALGAVRRLRKRSIFSCIPIHLALPARHGAVDDFQQPIRSAPKREGEEWPSRSATTP